MQKAIINRFGNLKSDYSEQNFDFRQKMLFNTKPIITKRCVCAAGGWELGWSEVKIEGGNQQQAASKY